MFHNFVCNQEVYSPNSLYAHTFLFEREDCYLDLISVIVGVDFGVNVMKLLF